MILNSHFSRTSCPDIFTWDRHGVDDQIYSRSERMRQFLRQPSPFADSLIWFPGLRVRPWKCCGWSIGPYACYVPPPPPIQIWPPNRTQRLNVAAPAECLNWKLPANRSFPSVVYLTEKQRGGRMNSELRFYFTSCLSRPFTLYRSACPPPLPPWPRSAPASGQHLSIALNPKM